MPININGNIIDSNDITSVGTFKNKIVTDGLVLHLDAGDINSYPGSGSTWYDISGKGNHFTFGSGISWNSAGYFDCSAGVFTGPASNTFGFNTKSENYVEAFAQVTTATSNVFFSWYASNDTGGDTRTVFSHFYYSNGNTYYDMNGCCADTQRISYANDTDFTAGVRHISYRTRGDVYPNRQIFKNLIPQVDSGTSNTANATWNQTTPAIIASNWSGKLYVFRVYNRPLEPFEMAINYNAQKARFGM